jgi:U3 small nucleolar RNA-associated protein 13
VLVWDLRGHYITHALRFSKHKRAIMQTGAHSVETGVMGPVQLVRFHPSKSWLAASDQTGAIWVWDLHLARNHQDPENKAPPLAILRNHMSTVTDLQLFESRDQSGKHHWLVSVSRDRVISLWRLEDCTLINTVTSYESMEALAVLPRDVAVVRERWPGHIGDIVLTGGERGVLRAFDTCLKTDQGANLFSEPSTDHVHGIDYMLVNATRDELIMITNDQNIAIYSLKTLTRSRVITGFNDEVIDMSYLDQGQSLVVATNSAQLRVYRLADWSTQLLSGHADTVLALDTSPCGRFIASAGKDSVLRVWARDQSGIWHTAALGEGHTEAITSLSFSKRSSLFVVTASRDKTLKVWDLTCVQQVSELDWTAPLRLEALFTQKAHDKEINAVSVAPNDSVIATASQDKTVKLWRRLKHPDPATEARTHFPRGTVQQYNREWAEAMTLSGHKRGVWAVQFSPVEQCIATGSADFTIKIWTFNWTTNAYTCIRTIEGSDSTVLRLAYLSRGLQLLSTASDGVLRLWDIRTQTMVNAMDGQSTDAQGETVSEGHADKVWALCVNRWREEQEVITGGSDSKIIVWHNTTQQEIEAEHVQREESVLKEQNLRNYIHRKEWLKAIHLALNMKHQGRLYSILDQMSNEAPQESERVLRAMYQGMDSAQLEQCLEYCRDWNTNAKHSLIAQRCLRALFALWSPQSLLGLPNIKQLLQASLPYTERHFQRLDRLIQRSFILDYTLQSMQLQADDTKTSVAAALPATSEVDPAPNGTETELSETSAKKRKRGQESEDTPNTKKQKSSHTANKSPHNASAHKKKSKAK